MTPEQRYHIAILVKKFSEFGSTEEIIGFAAEATGIITSCEALLEWKDRDEVKLQKWLEPICEKHEISFKIFLHEVEIVINLFHSSHYSNKHYSILGLTEGATQKEIKQAFRKLSLKYHPDTARGDNKGNTERFIQITQAYHSLNELDKREVKTETGKETTRWRSRNFFSINSRQRRNFPYWFFGTIFILLSLSVVITVGLKERAMLAGLQVSRGAPMVLTSKKVQVKIENDNLCCPELVKEDTVTTARPDKLKTQVITGMKDDQLNHTCYLHEDDTLTIENIIQEYDEENIAFKSKGRENTNIEQTQNSLISSKKNTLVLVGIPYEPVQNELSSQPMTSDFDANASKTTIIRARNTVDRAPSNPLDFMVVKKQDYISRANSLIKVTRDAANLSTSIEIANHQHQLINGKGNIHKSNPVKDFTKRVGNISSDSSANLRLRISNFLNSYIQAYEQQNLTVFASFFENDAFENDKPFTAMIPIYSDLFDKTSSVFMHLDVYAWSKFDKEILIIGKFVVNLNYNNGYHQSETGPISFILDEKGNTFKVQQLSYHFEEQEIVKFDFKSTTSRLTFK